MAERQLKIVRVDTDDGSRIVGLQVPKVVINAWKSELLEGTFTLAKGLGYANKVMDEIKPVNPHTLNKFRVAASMTATPSFFAGTRKDFTSHSVLAGTTQIHSNIKNDASPVHHSSPLHHAKLLSLQTNSSAAALLTPPAKKQTSLASFFAKPSANKNASSAAAATANLSATKLNPFTPTSLPSLSTPSPNATLKRTRHASEVIDLLTSESESESVEQKKKKPKMTPADRIRASGLIAESNPMHAEHRMEMEHEADEDMFDAENVPIARRRLTIHSDEELEQKVDTFASQHNGNLQVTPRILDEGKMTVEAVLIDHDPDDFLDEDAKITSFRSPPTSGSGTKLTAAKTVKGTEDDDMPSLCY